MSSSPVGYPPSRSAIATTTAAQLPQGEANRLLAGFNPSAPVDPSTLKGFPLLGQFMAKQAPEVLQAVAATAASNWSPKG